MLEDVGIRCEFRIKFVDFSSVVGKEKSVVGRAMCRLLEIHYYFARGYDDNENLEEGIISLDMYEEIYEYNAFLGSVASVLS